MSITMTPHFVNGCLILTEIGADVMIFKILSPKILRKTPFFRRKLAKIAENCDHNIDPGSVF
jgi:hypothetical protein